MLYAIALGGAVGEVAGLKGAGMVSTVPLAAQATAVTPIAAFHDVRWLQVYASSWPDLAGEVIVTVAIRALMTGAFVRAAWPGWRPPSWTSILPRAALAYFLTLVAMSPWGILSFAAAVGSLFYPLLGAVFFACLVGIFVLPHAGIAPFWWTRFAPVRAMAWTALDFLFVTAAAIAIDYSPSWVVLVSAAVAGLGNGWCWKHLVAACADTRITRPRPVRLAFVPLALASLVCGLAVGASSVVSAERSPHAFTRTATQAPPGRGRQVVLVVNGFGSHWNGARPSEYRGHGYDVTEFSYRGLGPHGRPLPYTSGATTSSLKVLARRLSTQVQHLAATSGRPVDVVADSEGTWVVKEYLATHAHAPLENVVLTSPLPRPDRAYYPPRGGGFGTVAAAEAQLLLKVPRAESPHEIVRTDIPMLRSLEAQGPLFRQRSLCPAAGTRIVALLPLSAAVVTPPGPVGGIPNGVVPAVHASVASTGTVRHEIEKVLAGKPLDHFFGWGFAFDLTRYAASAWESPSLPLSLVEAWQAAGGRRWGDAAFGGYGCHAVDHPSTVIHRHGNTYS